MSLEESLMPRVNCEKEAGGATFSISTGITGSDGQIIIRGLSRTQAEAASRLIYQTNIASVRSTQGHFRKAIGIN